jgi:RNA methyltransferase, TrmH family
LGKKPSSSKMLPYKKDIRLVKSLHLKKFRAQESLFIVEGRKMVSEALAMGGLVHSMYTTDAEFAEQHKNAFLINGREMEQISSFSTPSPYLAVLHQQKTQQDVLVKGDVVVLDGISDPGNFGTIMRTAEWFGIELLLCTNDCVECYNPKVVQASMGSVLRMQVVYLTEAEISGWLGNQHYEIVGAALGGNDVYAHTFGNKSALVIGSESHGIRPEMRKYIQTSLEIPGAGKAESLNASVAAGILLSELFRFRR